MRGTLESILGSMEPPRLVAGYGPDLGYLEGVMYTKCKTNHPLHSTIS